MDKQAINYENLNISERNIVAKAFEGQISSTSESSFFDSESSLNVAAPIIINGEVASVLLLNESNRLPSEFLNSAKLIFLISTLIGGILVTSLAIYFANKFISSVNKLNQVTKKMTAGDYKITTGVSQDDEIGDLATCIDNLADRLEKARLETEAMDQMKDDFISSMSHELKTPVTVLKSSLEALKFGVVIKEDEVQEYYEILNEEIGILEKLINDLMDLNILKNNKFKINKEEVNIIDVLRDSIRSQSPLAREKNIEIKREFSDGYIEFMGDYTRLRQLLITIINNAIKYSEENSTIDIIEETTDYGFVISISNKGEELSEESISHIFEPFYRNKNTSKKGMGLGLAIAKEIANHHDIGIEVERQGKNTSFILKFKK